MVTAQIAPSGKKVVAEAKVATTKEDVLKRIIVMMINHGNYLFYKPYLNREYVLGTVGDRGGGKSGSDAVIGIVDFMLRGKTVWSNMNIEYDITVPDELAQKYGLNSGGSVHYESIPIEKDKLLKLDETYRDGCLVIEEINVQYSNVRRFMSNTNIESNELYQQLRKFRTSLIYNVIDEMFVDPQLRALTDIFIRTYDTAFDIDAMLRKKKTGLDFCWLAYSYSGYLNGEQGRYALTKKADKWYFKFEPWQGVYDSWQHQERGTYSLNKRERAAMEKAGLNIESSEDIALHTLEWGWLGEKAIELKKAEITELVAWELWQHLELKERDINPSQTDFQNQLAVHGIHKSNQRNKYGERLYLISSFRLDCPPTDAARNT